MFWWVVVGAGLGRHLATTYLDGWVGKGHRIMATISRGLGLHVRDESMLPTHLPARVFAILVELACPVIKSYWSDLYHDAIWVCDQVKGPAEFIYGVRETGTTIGLDYELTAMHNTHVYRVRVYAGERGQLMCEVKGG